MAATPNRYLGLRGILRRHASPPPDEKTRNPVVSTSSVSLLNLLRPGRAHQVPDGSGSLRYAYRLGSLRDYLTYLAAAEKEIEYRCVLLFTSGYDWPDGDPSTRTENTFWESDRRRYAHFLQIWTHVIARIHLVYEWDSRDLLAHPVVPFQRRQMIETRFKSAIEDIWSNKVGYRAHSEIECLFTVEVQWVSEPDKAHASVRVSVGERGATSGHWPTDVPPQTIAHEFGHLILGLADEYDPYGSGADREGAERTGCLDPNRDFWASDGLMSVELGPVLPRYFRHVEAALVGAGFRRIGSPTGNGQRVPVQ